MKAVSRQHLKVVLSGKEDMTLEFDSTTKAGHRAVEVELSTNDVTYLLTIKEQNGGTARNTMPH